MENITNDPKHKARAEVIAHAFARKNLQRKAKVLKDGMSFIEGEHTPASWRVQDDGETLCVILNSGPKLYEPLKGPTTIEKIVDAIQEDKARRKEEKERQALLDAREVELNKREKMLNDKAAELEAKANPTPTPPVIIDPTDGIDEKEASAAGKALQASKPSAKK